MRILETHGLSIGYKKRRKPPKIIANDLSLTLQNGEFVCLIGPNGVGKSSLLRTLAGIQPALEGNVRLLENNIRNLHARDLAKLVSIVLTDRGDVGVLSAYRLAALGRYPYTDWSDRLTAHDEKVVQWALNAVGAAELAHRSVSELSDGERQKVMIARALAQEPRLLILDEPTAFLDLPRRVEIMQLLKQLAHTRQQTILLSTHDLDLALRSADAIWLMQMGGHLQTGTPEDLVLSGAFEAAFQSEGVKFDSLTGAFNVQKQLVGEIKLAGNGAAAIWTQRALERVGYAVSDNATLRTGVTVGAQNGKTEWILTIDEQTFYCASIHDLLNTLNR